MRSLLRDEVRRVDACAIETLGIPGVILMENAGRRTTDVAWEMLSFAEGNAVAVVAGGGNNGGDGFVIARHLDLRGADVCIYLTSPTDKLSGDALTNYQAAVALELEVVDLSDSPADLASRLAGVDLVVDAVGGTGISGALRGRAAEVVEQINAAGVDVLAVDIPTGLDCDQGTAEGPAVRAARTVTFVARKAGFDNPDSEPYTGTVTVVDIGIPAERIAARIGLDI
jgi:NAD(P)H-hydrate epimerase